MSFKKGTLNLIKIVFANNTYMGQAKTVNINNINNIHEIKYEHITKNKFNYQSSLKENVNIK